MNLGVAFWADREIRCNFWLNGVPFATSLGTPLLLRSLPQAQLPVGHVALLFSRFEFVCEAERDASAFCIRVFVYVWQGEGFAR